MELTTVLWVVFIAFLLIVFYKMGGNFGVEEEVEVQLNEDGMQQVAEYRTYIVNQWICLLAFWCGISADDAKTKLTTPGANFNGLYFFHQNLEVYALFNWDGYKMHVKTSVYTEDKGYLTHEKVFSLADGSLDADKLFKFIEVARIEHYGEYELTKQDVIDITRQLKVIEQPFESRDAALEHLFNHMADLMILAREKKFRNDKRFMKVYMGLTFCLWQEYGKEFLEFLSEEEEEKETDNTNGGTNQCLFFI